LILMHLVSGLSMGESGGQGLAGEPKWVASQPPTPSFPLSSPLTSSLAQPHHFGAQ
jgi:hypothetical protein